MAFYTLLSEHTFFPIYALATLTLQTFSCCTCQYLGHDNSASNQWRSAGSREIAELALKVRPRYLVASGPVFFARLPYLNKDLGAGKP